MKIQCLDSQYVEILLQITLIKMYIDDHVLVALQESYVILEKVIRSLANFYSKAGPSAPLSQEVKSEILDYLNTAEEFL